jgi:hypothetical protein
MPDFFGKTEGQLELPLSLPTNHNNERVDWHEICLAKNSLREYNIMKSWCHQNIANCNFSVYIARGCAIWRFRHPHDFMMFSLTWG